MENEMILSEEPDNTNILPDQEPKQSDELPPNDAMKEIDAKVLEEIYRTLLKLSKKRKQATLRVNRVRQNTKCILPISSKNLTNTGEVLGLKEFLSSMLYSVFYIPLHYHYSLLVLGPIMVRYRAQLLTAQFVIKLGNSSKSQLRLGEAITEFFPQITEMMTMMLCYVLILWLVCPLHPVLQISIVLMLITAPCYYVPDLLGMAPGVGVSYGGSLKVPLIWFTALGALALSLVFASLSLLLMYLIQRYIRPHGQRKKELNVSLDALSEVLNGVNLN